MRPSWLKVKAPTGDGYDHTMGIVKQHQLHTVCESAHCPNIGECWGYGTATFMILGNICTRSCGFCAVKTGRPNALDLDEPKRVAEAVKLMDLKYAVITSVDRDDLPDGGSNLFAETIRQVRAMNPECKIEVLIPDFRGKREQLDNIIEARPDVLNHNTETVPSLYRKVRPQARYEWTLGVLKHSRFSGITTKSGLMLGLGESAEELTQVMSDLVENGCEILTLGQYLQPTLAHLPVERFVSPDEFDHYKLLGLKLGFKAVESGPLVRSSYHADQTAKLAKMA